MARCKYCEQNNVITEGTWQQTQYGNRLFVNGQQHKCPYYKKPTQTAPQQFQQPAQQFANREKSDTYIPQGYVQGQHPAPVTDEIRKQQEQELMKLTQDVSALNIRLADIQQYQIGIEALLAKLNQKMDLLLSASGVENALGPKALSEFTEGFKVVPDKPALGDMENP